MVLSCPSGAVSRRPLPGYGVSEVLDELFGRDIRLPEDAAEGALVHFAMHGNDADAGIPAQHDVAAALATALEAQPKQGLDDAGTGDAWQLGIRQVEGGEQGPSPNW